MTIMIMMTLLSLMIAIVDDLSSIVQMPFVV